MFSQQASIIQDKCGVSEILEDILKRTFREVSPVKTITKASLEIDNCLHKPHCLTSGGSLCNCTQTGEVKILVKKITDLENEHQKTTKLTNQQQKMESSTNVTNQQQIYKNIYASNEAKPKTNQNINGECFINEIYYPDDDDYDINNISARQNNDSDIAPNLTRQQKYLCICKCQNINVNTPIDRNKTFINEVSPYFDSDTDASLMNQNDPDIECENDANDNSDSVPPISKDNIEEISDFLVKACEKRHLRRLSLQEPQIVPEEYQVNETPDPFASILEQGDHIMDTFQNLLTDTNGSLTVRISFSYCAKLLAILLTLNTIFFSKIIVWDSFLQHLF